MHTHVKVAAWLRIVGSAVYLLVALVVMAVFGGTRPKRGFWYPTGGAHAQAPTRTAVPACAQPRPGFVGAARKTRI